MARKPMTEQEIADLQKWLDEELKKPLSVMSSTDGRRVEYHRDTQEFVFTLNSEEHARTKNLTEAVRVWEEYEWHARHLEESRRTTSAR